MPALIAALKDQDPRVRRQAAWALGAIDDTRAVPGLIQALEDADERTRSAGRLGARRDRRSVAPCQRCRERSADKTPAVRKQAAWALGAIDDRVRVDALVRALSDEQPGVREQAAWALGAIGDGRALSALLVALKDDSAGVRRQAAWAIGVIGR